MQKVTVRNYQGGLNALYYQHSARITSFYRTWSSKFQLYNTPDFSNTEINCKSSPVVANTDTSYENSLYLHPMPVLQSQVS